MWRPIVCSSIVALALLTGGTAFGLLSLVMTTLPGSVNVTEVLAAGSATATVAGTDVGGTASKDSSPRDPISALPPEQQDAARQKVIQDIRDAQPGFIAQFAASGEDYHDLAIAELSPQVLGVGSVEEALTHSVLAVRGVVLAQSTGQGVISELRVSTVLAGELEAPSINVRQPGGPFLNGSDPVLLQWQSDPILWKGHEYVLFLSPCTNPPSADALCIAASGQQLEVANGLVRATVEDTWIDAYRGRPVDELLAAIAAAS